MEGLIFLLNVKEACPHRRRRRPNDASSKRCSWKKINSTVVGAMRRK